ncbi:MAG: hypothetical protein R3277_00450 [Brumimicrobium sp.]|nr:hypothetical protein [Brumimicrobium sp.]
MKKVLFYTLIVSMIIINVSCNSTGKIISNSRPALVNKQVSASEEIKYMLSTDQEDRSGDGSFLTGVRRTMKMVNDEDFRQFLIERDSLRVTRAWQLLQNDQIKSLEDKYNAAFIFTHHSYNIKIPADSISYFQAYLFFSEVAIDTTDENIKEAAAFYGHEAFKRYQSARSGLKPKSGIKVKRN